MSRINNEHPAEEFLCHEGLIKSRSAQRRALLGCVGCRWLKAGSKEDAKFYGLEVINCTRLKPGTIYPALKKLEETGVMVRKQEDIDPITEGRPVRKFYYPTDSELGKAFWDELTVPSSCPLEQDALAKK